MKRRGFLGLLGALPVAKLAPRTAPSVPPALPQPTATPLPPLPWYDKNVPVPSAPAYSFSNDSDAGIYRTEANTIGFCVDGRQIMELERDWDL